MLAQSGDSLHVLFVDIDWAASVNQGTLAVVGDDEVALNKVDVEDLYHKKLLGSMVYLYISQKGRNL